MPKIRLFQNKIAQNASWIIVSKVVQAVFALIINMLTARYLGPSNYGVLNYAASVVAFVVPVMNLGFTGVLVQEFTEHPEEEGKIIGTSVLLSLFSAIACIGGIVTYTLIVDAGEKTTNLVVVLYGIMLIAQAMELIQYWYQSKLLSKYTAVVALCAYLAVSFYKIVLIVLKVNVTLFAISYSIDYFLIAAALFVIYGKLGGQRPTFSGEVGKRMFHKSKHFIISGLMITVFAQTDKIMIKLMINEAAVGYYSAAVSCAAMTSFVFIAIIDSFRPVIFGRKNENDIEGYEKNIEKLYCIVIYLAIVQSIFMTLFARIIIKILYGDQYFAAVNALKIIVWYSAFSYVGGIRDIWILGEKKQKYLWLVNLCGALMNIILNLIFINLFGIYGAALASLLTQIFTNIIMSLIIWPLRHNNMLILKSLDPRLILGFVKKNKSNGAEG